MMRDVEIDAADLQRLAEYVARRRQNALRLTIVEAAATASMSPTTWGQVENARPVRKGTYSAIDRVLGWSNGTCWAVLTEGAHEPQVGSPTDGPPPPSADRGRAGITKEEFLRWLDGYAGISELDKAAIRAAAEKLHPEPDGTEARLDRDSA